MRNLLLGVLCACLLAACGGSDGESGPPGEMPAGALYLKGSGATFPAILYQAWFKKYREVNPKVWVDYNPTGSGAGERSFLAEAVDFGASDAAALTDEQIDGLKRGVRFIPAAAGAIVIVYNLPEIGDKELRLSRANYVDIFLGRIERWNDPELKKTNPGLDLPDREIAVVARSDGSGTTFAFTNHLAAVSEQWKNGPGVGKRVDWPRRFQRAPGNLGNAARVRRYEGSISYVQYGFALQLGLKMASLENRAGRFVAPSATSGMSTLAAVRLPEDLRAYVTDPDGPNSYPIVTMTWMLLYGTYSSADKAGAMRDLVSWCLGEGQKHSQELGYIPLAPQVVAAARKALGSIGS